MDGVLRPSLAMGVEDGGRRGDGARLAQGRPGGVVEGVHVAELEGHVSRSAVSLIHIEVRTGAGIGEVFRPASITKKTDAITRGV